MRHLAVVSLLFSLCLLALTRAPAQEFELPVRINCGGRSVVDSNGNIWLADQGVNVDPLNIRPNDIGGGQAIENWSAAVVPASVTALGFDGNNPEDLQIFKDIRWDNAGEVPDWYMEIPVPDGFYTVNFYLVDAGDGRHYQIELEGEIVAEDVHQLAFPVGEGQVPGPHIAGKYSFDLEVSDGTLDIGMLPGFGLPGAGDPNPILQGLEILPMDPDADPCDNPAFRGRCTSRLQCEEAGGEAAISWAAPGCFEPLGYEVYRNDELILELAADETSFEDVLESRNTRYRIETLAPAGVRVCPTLTCSIAGDSMPFTVPLRINFAGPEVTDSNGDVWLGDLDGPGDPLGIRPIDANGANHIADWCAASFASIEELGFDAFGPMASVLSSIRWDSDSFSSPFELELPVPDGEYTVNLFFIECCCANRHFSISLEDEMVYDDVHQGDFSPGPNVAGGIGFYSFEGIEVFDGSLSISFVGIPGGDVNALVTALELIPEDLVPEEICDNGIDDDRDGQTDCDDVGCILADACIPAEICGNGIDDDRDGRADCDDEDCVDAANCLQDGPLFVRGDANSDGSVNLTDGVVPLLYLFSGGAAPACLDSADTNDTGTVEITDAIIIFSWLFSGGAPPAEPSPLSPGYSREECAADPTEDGIGCARPSATCN